MSSGHHVGNLQLVSPGSHARLRLIQPLDKLGELGPTFILQRILVSENGLEDWHELRSKLPGSGVFPFVWIKLTQKFLNNAMRKGKEHTHLANHPVQGVILLEIVLEGQDADKYGKDFLDRNAFTVSEDHAAETSSGIVLEAGDIHLQAVFESAEDSREFIDDVRVVGVLDQASNGIGGVGLGLGVLIAEAVNQELEEGRRELGDGGTHAIDALGKDTHSGGTLERLAAAGVAENGLLENLPELSKALAKGGSHAGHDVERRVDDNPVELGGLFRGHLILTELNLARVLLVDDVGDHLDDVMKSGLVGNERRTAIAQVFGHVAVDISDGSPR